MLEAFPVEPFGHRPFLIDNTHFNGLLISSLADRRISLVVSPLIFCDVSFRGVHGPVGTGVGDIEKKRLIRCFVVATVIADESDRIVIDCISVVEGFGLIAGVIFGSNVGIATAKGGGIIETTCSRNGAVKAVEATLHRPC